MRLKYGVLAAGLFWGLTLSARATTWAETTLTDPLTGEKVPAREIASFGGYIYEWPSKFDLVFWPMTDESFICLNPKSGYAAFNDEFEKLTPEEVEKLRDWLAKNYDPERPPRTHIEKLEWLERVYEQRRMPPTFWRRFYCLMAYMLREDEARSLAYVRKALPLLEEELSGNPSNVARIEVLYLLGEYHRRIGETEKARDFFRQVRGASYVDSDGKTRTSHPYFVGLVRDREKLLPPPAAPSSKPAAPKSE